MLKKFLEKKNKYIHRDLSWLQFNERVLEEGFDPQNPLMERARFLAIAMNNLDEFFMVRVAGLRRMMNVDQQQQDAYGFYPKDIYDEVYQKSKLFIERVYQGYEEKLKPLMAQEKIFVRRYEELNEEQQKFVKRFFDTTLYSVMTPMAIDQGHPFPVLLSKTMAFAVYLKRNKEPFLAILPIPTSVDRLLKLPSGKDEQEFICIEEIIRYHLKAFFRGYDLVDASLFRVMRDSEIFVNEEFSPNLLVSIEEEIRKRPKADVVHLCMESSVSTELKTALSEGIDFLEDEIILLNSIFDLTILFSLASKIKNVKLFYPKLSPSALTYDQIFERIKEKDLLLHLPYQSFYPTIDLLKTASVDPNVLAIKMTLYRASDDSEIIKALKEAAKRKKQVTVLVEIKARFDEERNISWVKQLEEAGCHVMYGIAGVKIHSKIMLIVRREEERTKRYVHLSTGNYNEKTALVYTDIGFFTANEDFAKDISDMFNVITGYSQPARWQRVISAPYDLRQNFLDLIDEEISYQKTHQNGFIFAKMNSLEDTKIIDKLYEASQAGVKIQLIVRGICVLIPGVMGLSENIVVKSIVGRFLEHSRIYLFNHQLDYRVFLSSADWMRRNFDSRIELMFEIKQQDLKEELKNILEKMWQDNQKSRLLTGQKTYVYKKSKEDVFHAQEYFLTKY